MVDDVHQLTCGMGHQLCKHFILGAEWPTNRQAPTPPPPDCLLAQAFHGPRDSTPTHGVSALLSRFLTANASTQHCIVGLWVAKRLPRKCHSRRTPEQARCLMTGNCSPGHFPADFRGSKTSIWSPHVCLFWNPPQRANLYGSHLQIKNRKVRTSRGGRNLCTHDRFQHSRRKTHEARQGDLAGGTLSAGNTSAGRRGS